jgi:hypothetical protein
MQQKLQLKLLDKLLGVDQFLEESYQAGQARQMCK